MILPGHYTLYLDQMEFLQLQAHLMSEPPRFEGAWQVAWQPDRILVELLLRRMAEEDQEE